MGTQKARLKRAPRIVLDTNVLVSALILGGARWNWLRLAWQSGRAVPVVSRDTADELLRVLAYPKFHLHPDEREDLLADYLPYAEVIDVPDAVQGVPELRDHEDAKFLALALCGGVDFLVSGDKDLLTLRTHWKRLAIVTPADFKAWLEEKST